MRRIAVVIPAFRELDQIEETLGSLSASRTACSVNGDIVDVVVVVNHPINASSEIREESHATLVKLGPLSKEYNFALHVLNATQPGLTSGVGEARKLGMDFAAKKILLDPEDLICCLDADCQVSENYFEVLLSHPFYGAAFTLGFSHRTENPELGKAIDVYDRYLRYMQKMLERAGSPFAFFTIGSCIGTNVRFYELSRGMPARPATEDFHFLNKLRKLGDVEYWPEATVYPAVRSSTRVFLGTGYFIQTYVQNPAEAFSTLVIPSPQSFERLSTFLRNLENDRTLDDPIASEFLKKHRLDTKIDRIRKNSASPESYRKKLLQLFDGLMTYRLLRTYWETQGPNSEENFKRYTILDKTRWASAAERTPFSSKR